ncbi:MAG TPA: phosphoribosylformylglycinamidine synthase subunit PurS [Thermoanaerobaculia bacterium]|nr:phosphoribosylformylglycinamidine synthase subunit PurS [Thermoanaerobaculia bacterium]
MRARITVYPRREILDPQGKAIRSALAGLGFDQVEDVRAGKSFEVELATEDGARARDTLDAMCRKLLANTVTEDYEIELDGGAAAGAGPAAKTAAKTAAAKPGAGTKAAKPAAAEASKPVAKPAATAAGEPAKAAAKAARAGRPAKSSPPAKPSKPASSSKPAPAGGRR